MLCIIMCETIFKLSYMFFLSFLPLPLLINIHIFVISEMTTHPTMTPTFESAMLSFSPGVNSRAELVTLSPGLSIIEPSRLRLVIENFAAIMI